jgi:hypothetical protein
MIKKLRSFENRPCLRFEPSSSDRFDGLLLMLPILEYSLLPNFTQCHIFFSRDINAILSVQS